MRKSTVNQCTSALECDSHVLKRISELCSENVENTAFEMLQTCEFFSNTSNLLLCSMSMTNSLGIVDGFLYQ